MPYTTKKDLSGKRYGRLTAIKYAGVSKNQKSLFLCKCDCGKEIIAIGGNLSSGTTTSCGCWREELRKKKFLDSNKNKPHWNRIRSIYYGMIARCYHQNDLSYPRYGGRGISVCDEWKKKGGLSNFYKWAIKNGYSDDLSIDRINNNENYNPSNCRWADDFIQANNRSNNHHIVYQGEDITVSNFARKIGRFDDLRKINYLINYKKMSPEEISTKYNKENKKNECMCI